MKGRGLPASALKWIAIIAMTIDHIAWKQNSLPDWLYILTHVIGRLTMPIMCYLLAQGFYHTKSRERYAARLFVFAVLAQVPFTYYMHGVFFVPRIGAETFNVLFALFFGFCALWAVTSDIDKPTKIITVALCLFFSTVCDWMIFGVLWILAFGLNRDNFKRQAFWFSLIAISAALYVSFNGIISGNYRNLMQFGTLLSLPLLSLYNGKRSSDNAPALLANKWLFYVYYPVHLAVIGILW